MTKRKIDTLILDLDNTIFDWFEVWYSSFNPIYEEIIRLSGKSAAEVEADIRRVHQKTRTSEYTFLLEELEVVKGLDDVPGLFQGAVEIAKANRDKNLRLYPSVFRSLWDIKKKGTKIIAYTESMGFYSAYRLKRFGLDGVIEILFCPQDHDVPSGVSLDKIRSLPDDFYHLHVTEMRHTPIGELKPNAVVLKDIINSIGANKDRVAYVGDSMFKDVAMARDVGVFDIHAEYGDKKKPEYKLLQRVSHWTDADVAREHEIAAKGTSFRPSAILKDTFAEIFIYCDFEDFSKKDLSDNICADKAIEIWKQCVQVQMHFNDLSLKIRNVAITLIGALIAAVGFTYQQQINMQVFGFSVPAGLGILFAAVVSWGAFYLMDRYWYHVLLKGAVKHTIGIENQFKNTIPGIGLSKSIGEASANVKIGCKEMKSEARLNAFYLVGTAVLILMFVFLILAKPEVKKDSLPSISAIQDDANKQLIDKENKK